MTEPHWVLMVADDDYPSTMPLPKAGDLIHFQFDDDVEELVTIACDVEEIGDNAVRVRFIPDPTEDDRST